MYKSRYPNSVNIFRSAFREVSAFLSTKLRYEKDANQYNMESGLPLEDYFRQEFGKFIPERFSVGAGKIIDREQYTCGDCDFVLYDKRFAPFVKFPTAQQSRRKLLAFETTYGIIEVKQNLTLGALENGDLKDVPSGSLYDACKKIFAYKELTRDIVGASQVIPGFTIPELRGDVQQYNKPFGFAFFYGCEFGLDDPESVDNFLLEFRLINQSVPPEMRVNGLFVLDSFSVAWLKESGVPDPTYLTSLYPEESPKPLFSLIKSGSDTLYFMYALVWNLLLKTHLNSPNFNADYGGREFLQDFQHVLP